MSKFTKIVIALIIILIIEVLLIYRGYKIKNASPKPIGDKPIFSLLSSSKAKIQLKYSRIFLF